MRHWKKLFMNTKIQTTCMYTTKTSTMTLPWRTIVLIAFDNGRVRLIWDIAEFFINFFARYAILASRPDYVISYKYLNLFIHLKWIVCHTYLLHRLQNMELRKQVTSCIKVPNIERCRHKYRNRWFAFWTQVLNHNQLSATHLNILVNFTQEFQFF